MARFAVLLSVLLALPAFQSLAAETPAKGTARRETVEARLRAHELPPSAQELAALGRGVDVALVAVAGDPKVDLLVRARAVSALGYVPTAPARKFLEETVTVKPAAGAEDAKSNKLLVRKAALALGWIGGSSAPRRIAPLLEHPDPDVRIDAALALGMTRQEQAADLLRAKIGNEKVDGVRTHLARQLRVIEAALAPPAPRR